MDYNDINKRILELCEKRKWSKYRLAQKSKIGNSAISAMFNHNHVPTFHNLKKICDAFEISLAQFFDSNLFYQKKDNKLYIELWNDLTSDDRKKVLIYMYGLSHKAIKKEDFENDI